jgi:hypothetical protein
MNSIWPPHARTKWCQDVLASCDIKALGHQLQRLEDALAADDVAAQNLMMNDLASKSNENELKMEFRWLPPDYSASVPSFSGSLSLKSSSALLFRIRYLAITLRSFLLTRNKIEL